MVLLYIIDLISLPPSCYHIKYPLIMSRPFSNPWIPTFRFILIFSSRLVLLLIFRVWFSLAFYLALVIQHDLVLMVLHLPHMIEAIYFLLPEGLPDDPALAKTALCLILTFGF